ncbi:CDP-diacylglycerol--glycerol-3-phosphate 3-phosphatidyltransferase [Fodinibacter luteus]|uniref:CDP-diacylglycerol--glycerol-3-phosphate 3-phosphatidyltransferase n=1 Tax=Fodinibacter luteus TaxID=552064 RepID=A0ABP8KBZ4_9MICO
MSEKPLRPVRPGPLAEGRATDPYRVGVDPASPAVPATGPSAWNIANYLTMVRLLLVPVFGWLLLHDDGRSAGYRWAAFAVFVVAMITDRIDGDLARSRGLVTNFGKVVDPIADKALVTMALVGLSLVGEVWWWVTVVVLVREWGITAVRFWVIRHGVMAAGRGGKVKTLLQTVGIGFYLMPRWTLPFPELWDWLAAISLGAAVVVTVVTGVDYLVQALRLRRTSERAARKRAERAERAAVRRAARGGR